MRKLWTVINGMKLRTAQKNRCFLALMVLICALVGALLWCIVGRLLLPGAEWLLCFIGYPAVFVGFFGGILYLYNHGF